MNPRVHTFEDSGEAYDASQCYDEIRDGDVLYVPSENAAAVLIEAWPVAVTENTGEFHQATEALDWSAVTPVGGGPDKDYTASRALALKVVMFDRDSMEDW